MLIWIRDPESFLSRIRDGKIRIRDNQSGSATTEEYTGKINIFNCKFYSAAAIYNVAPHHCLLIYVADPDPYVFGPP